MIKLQFFILKYIISDKIIIKTFLINYVEWNLNNKKLE